MQTAFQDELIQYAENLGFGELHIKLDAATDMCAIIAIHSTKLGPALGGCRFIEYDSFNAAIQDALRLAQGMTSKSAIANLPLGGGKTVLMKPKQLKDRTAIFQALGRFVNDLGGRYIAAMDSGTEVADMDAIATQTSFVTNLSKHDGNPAPATAVGVRLGIQAAIKAKLKRNSFEGLHVAIQGVGHVGYLLAKDLHNLGAKLTIHDINLLAVQRCVDEFSAQSTDAKGIFSVDCDVFAPCALGAILNDTTIPLLKAPIVAGSANNQLAEPKHGKMLYARDILYVPDYLINAGGLIHAYDEYKNQTSEETTQHIHHIYNQCLEIFSRAQHENRPPNEIADIIVTERLAHDSNPNH